MLPPKYTPLYEFTNDPIGVASQVIVYFIIPCHSQISDYDPFDHFSKDIVYVSYATVKSSQTTHCSLRKVHIGSTSNYDDSYIIYKK